jgi:hypothetical protein
MKQFMALAFIPKADVDRSYNELLDGPFVTANEEILVPFLRYFEKTWVGDLDRRRRRRNPLYAVQKWNCYESVLHDLNKTNNAVEGFHRGFESMLGAAHPTVFKLLDSLMKQQTLTETNLEQSLAGAIFNPQRKCHREAATRLKNVVQKFGTLTTLEYLRGVAHCLDILDDSDFVTL